jgi:glycosyltransferase involved in cell wall biosynthesis
MGVAPPLLSLPLPYALQRITQSNTEEVQTHGGRRLLIAGIVQDTNYFREEIQPHLNDQIEYVGPVGVEEKNGLFARAFALLHLNTIPERFGLVLAEANAAGVSP